jgi:hypothetical protein
MGLLRLQLQIDGVSEVRVEQVNHRPSSCLR